MHELDQAFDETLRGIGAACPHLRYALQQSADAVGSEFMSRETACRALEAACAGLGHKSAAASAQGRRAGMGRGAWGAASDDVAARSMA